MRIARARGFGDTDRVAVKTATRPARLGDHLGMIANGRLYDFVTSWKCHENLLQREPLECAGNRVGGRRGAPPAPHAACRRLRHGFPFRPDARLAWFAVAEGSRVFSGK